MLVRSEEHTSELQSHSEISYAVFCLKKKKTKKRIKPCNGFHGETHPHNHPQIQRRCASDLFFFFFFNDTATTEIYTNLNTLSLHDALPISQRALAGAVQPSQMHP